MANRLIISSLLLSSAVAGATVQLSNIVPHRAVAGGPGGSIMDAHDGSISILNGPRGKEFFWYAMGYGYNIETHKDDCVEDGKWCVNCGRHFNNTIGIWTSKDLSSESWVFRGDAMIKNGAGAWPWAMYYRSHALYNDRTKRYVLWANVGDGPGGPYAVASSSSADGPFEYVGGSGPSEESMRQAGISPRHGGLGDMSLFMDEDGTAYVIVTVGAEKNLGRDMLIYELTEDFLNFTEKNSGILPGPHLVEAPDMFRRGDTYYAMLGGCTCFGRHGNGIAYATATHPLGPYTHRSSKVDPGCNISSIETCEDVGPKGPSQGGGNSTGSCRPLLQAQQNFIIQYPKPDGTTGFIWTGDRWQASPDGLFAHDPQTWSPISFGADGAIEQLQWYDSFDIELALPLDSAVAYV